MYKDNEEAEEGHVPCLDSSLEPRARVVVVTISMAMGMEATMSTTVKERASTGAIPDELGDVADGV